MSESMIDFGAMNLDEAVDPVCAPAGEYKLRCVGVKIGETGQASKNPGRPFLLPRFEIIEMPTAKELTRYVGLPCEGMDEKTRNYAMLGVKNLLLAMGLKPGKKYNPETDWVGCECFALLKVVDNNDEYGEQNDVVRFVAPK